MLVGALEQSVARTAVTEAYRYRFEHRRYESREAWSIDVGEVKSGVA